MNYLYAPNERRAQYYLSNNGFGLDRSNTKVRLNYSNCLGETYTEGDVIYVLDDCDPYLIAQLHLNVTRSGGAPRVISVEER